jgi:hypothetical protein
MLKLPACSVSLPYLFLCRRAFMRFLYLCFDILDRRFFLIEPTVLLLYINSLLKI